MGRIFNKDNFSLKSNFLSKFLCFFGVLFFITGIICVSISFRFEVLDDKYIIKKVKEYNSYDSKKHSKGELDVFKDIEYIEDGIYKVTYINYAKYNNGKSLVEKDSYFYITDMIGDKYKLVFNKVIINDKKYKINSNLVSSNEGINFGYIDNSVNIEIPDSLLFDKNKVVFYIKLIGRDTGVKYFTSNDAYYSFIPSKENDFYKKKTVQSYIIDGAGYIILNKK